MSYVYSQTDKSNLDWFKKDDSRVTLISIELMEGNIRGLYPFKVEFNYPISVVAGKNGTGKSTLLAIAACAYHNKENGFKLAEVDLKYRGPGEFLGTRQSGYAGFRFANLSDLKLIESSRKYAQDIINKDPELKFSEHKLLREQLFYIWPEIK